MNSPEVPPPPAGVKLVASVDAHPLRQEAVRLRIARQRSAFWFLGVLIVALPVLAGLYVGLHYHYPIAGTKWPASELVEFDPAGRISRIGDRDLQWYLGRDQTAKLVGELTARSQQIDALENRVVRQSLFEFQVRFSAIGDLSPAARQRIDELACQARSGNFGGAAVLFTKIMQGWSDETRRAVGEKSIFDLGYGLAELQWLKAAQVSTLGRSLEPPLVHQIFWMSPIGALAEAVCWSVFGTLVNLLLNVSQARAIGRFRPDEVWVSVAKLVYGPALSFVLVLTLYFGVLDAGTEMRFWFLPLAGFLFGYNARKVAILIDQLSAKLLGNVGASVNQLGAAQAQAATAAAAALRAQARPASFAELKQQAPVIADTATVAAVIKQQSKP